MKSFQTLIQFSVVGASGTLINLSIFNALMFIPFCHQHYLLTNLFSVLIATSSNFYWNNRWTFKNQASHKTMIKKYRQFFTISFSVLALNTIILATCVNQFAINRRIANIIAIGCCMFLNYLGNRLYTFGD